MRAVDDDARAFDAVMAAGRMPKATHEEQARREAAIQEATLRAIEVPLSVMRSCAKAVPLVDRVAREGNKNSVSDAGVAALCLETASKGAHLNVLINTQGMKDKKAAEKIVKEAGSLHEQVKTGVTQIVAGVENSIGG
jgi:glutamate formiminotransferase/formiminotetrahydrofolate cyclodeaminase